MQRLNRRQLHRGLVEEVLARQVPEELLTDTKPHVRLHLAVLGQLVLDAIIGGEETQFEANWTLSQETLLSADILNIDMAFVRELTDRLQDAWEGRAAA